MGLPARGKAGVNPDTIIGGLVGTGGTVLIMLLRWWMGRGDREARRLKSEAKQKQDIESANDKLGAALREELRRDNNELRDRVSKAEAQIASLTADRDALRRENMKLTEQNGAQGERIAALVKQNESMEVRIKELEIDRQILIDALRGANIPLPVELYRKPGTGPLGKGV